MNRVTPGMMFLLVATVGLTACVTPQPPPPETESTVATQATGTSEPAAGESHSAEEEGVTCLRNETETGTGVDVDVDTGDRAEGVVDVDVDRTTDADTDASGAYDDDIWTVDDSSATSTSGTTVLPEVDPREVIETDKTRGYKEPQEAPTSGDSKPEEKPKPPGPTGA